MRVIFLKNDPSLFARLIRLWTWSPYSHSELLFRDGLIFSAHARGTSFNQVVPEYYSDWDVLEVPVSEADEARIRAFCVAEAGCSYDWYGIVVSQVIGLRREHADKWFCSEVCAAALKLVDGRLRRKACTYSPAGLYKALVASGATPASF